MELKNKFNPNGEYLSVLKLLPAAIFAIASVLSLEDRQVLAYMITNSAATTAAATDRSKSTSKKCSENGAHVFGCDCFECYTIYWFKWDSSPNRHLIHEAIKAFEEEEHLNKNESENPKKRDKSGRLRIADSPLVVLGRRHEKSVPVLAEDNNTCFIIDANDVKLPEIDVASTEAATVERGKKDMTVRTTMSCHNHNKGLARKVLPDVLGLFNSRLWKLWGPDLNGCDYPCH